MRSQMLHKGSIPPLEEVIGIVIQKKSRLSIIVESKVETTKVNS